MLNSIFIAPGAVVLGDVTLGEAVGIWYNATVRGDRAPIVIGKRSNVQDNAVVHVDAKYPVTIGENVTIGHGAIIHGCEIGDNSLLLGNPAKVKREVMQEEIASSLHNADVYVEEARECLMALNG